MSGQQHEKTRERAPANLGIKFNPALGAANLKRFYATVRALLKSNQESGELALAVLEGRANSSKQSLVLFEPRATDYAKVVAALKETDDEAKALAAGKAEARSVEDVKPDEHIARGLAEWTLIVHRGSNSSPVKPRPPTDRPNCYFFALIAAA